MCVTSKYQMKFAFYGDNVLNYNLIELFVLKNENFQKYPKAMRKIELKTATKRQKHIHIECIFDWKLVCSGRKSNWIFHMKLKRVFKPEMCEKKFNAANFWIIQFSTYVWFGFTELCIFWLLVTNKMRNE